MTAAENAKAALGKAALDKIDTNCAPHHSENLAFIQSSQQKIIVDSNITICEPSTSLRRSIIQDNTFANPAIEEAERNGRYSGHLDQEIKTFRSLGNDIVVRRGYGSDLLRLFERDGISPEIIEQRTCPQASFPELKGISLYPYQQRVIQEVQKPSQGVIIAPTGSGKTILGLELIRQKKTPSIILVHTKELLNQWHKEILRLFGINAGVIGGGQWSTDSSIVVCTVQTLVRDEEKCRTLMQNFGLVLVDETHHAPCKTISDILSWSPCKFRYGLSATPSRRDGLDVLIFRSVGEIVSIVTKEEVENFKSVVPASVKIVKTGFSPSVNSWPEFVSSLDCHERNAFIIGLIPSDQPTLILTDRIDHAENLSLLLDEYSIPHLLAHGQIPSRKRKTLAEDLKNHRITIGTTALLGEGLNVAHWEHLILASPLSSEVRLMQAIGRIVRSSQGKLFGSVVDLHDDCGFSGASLKKRIDVYKKHRIKFEFTNNLIRKNR